MHSQQSTQKKEDKEKKKNKAKSGIQEKGRERRGDNTVVKQRG